MLTNNPINDRDIQKRFLRDWSLEKRLSLRILFYRYLYVYGNIGNGHKLPTYEGDKRC